VKEQNKKWIGSKISFNGIVTLDLPSFYPIKRPGLLSSSSLPFSLLPFNPIPFDLVGSPRFKSFVDGFWDHNFLSGSND
jgi:hypothetical protein